MEWWMPIVGGLLAGGLVLLIFARGKSRLAQANASQGFQAPSSPKDAAVLAPIAPNDSASLHPDAQALLAQQLMPGETVRLIIQGPSDQALIATEQRLFIYKRGSVAGAWFGQKMGSWDYRNITGIEMEKGLMGGAIIVQVPGAPAVDRGYFSAFDLPNGLPVVNSAYDAAARGVAELRRLIAQHQSAGGNPQGGLGQEIERLASLHERGQITDEEFTTMKRRLLAP